MTFETGLETNVVFETPPLTFGAKFKTHHLTSWTRATVMTTRN